MNVIEKKPKYKNPPPPAAAAAAGTAADDSSYPRRACPGTSAGRAATPAGAPRG